MWSNDVPALPTPPRAVTDNPVCTQCGRSVVSRFGGKPADTCWSCEDTAYRIEETVFWGDAA